MQPINPHISNNLKRFLSVNEFSCKEGRVLLKLKKNVMVKSLTFMGSGAGVGTGEKTQETVKNGPALLH